VPVFPPGTENDDFPPILVNIGDLLNYWTNGLFMSTIHRVVFPPDGGDDRYSIAYFCHPANDTELVQVPSPVISNVLEGEKTRSDQEVNHVMTAEEHLKFRLAATYGWGKQNARVGG
jgi:isopenicillin N synthase-like dioxygenase